MRRKQFIAAGLAALLPVVHAAEGSVQFEALTPTTIAPGGSVTFQATFLKSQDYLDVNLGDPEPAPGQGVQTWLVSGRDFLEESFSGVQLVVSNTAGPDLVFQDGPPSPQGGGLPYSTQWTFTLSFASEGTALVSPLATWVSSVQSFGDRTVAERNCFPVEGAELFCTDWATTYTPYNLPSDSSGTAGWGELQVTVVPEPAAAWLLLCGLAGLAGAQRFSNSRQPSGPRPSSVSMLRS